jgi:hypothetical protein
MDGILNMGLVLRLGIWTGEHLEAGTSCWGFIVQGFTGQSLEPNLGKTPVGLLVGTGFPPPRWIKALRTSRGKK